MRTDILTANLGSLVTLEGRTSRGRTWLRTHVNDCHIAIVGGCVCDPRCAVDIMRGAIADGLTLKDANSGRIARNA